MLAFYSSYKTFTVNLHDHILFSRQNWWGRCKQAVSALRWGKAPLGCGMHIPAGSMRARAGIAWPSTQAIQFHLLDMNITPCAHRLAALSSHSSSFESLIQSSWTTIKVWLSPCSVCKALLKSVGWKLHRKFKSMEPQEQLILTLLQLGPEFLQISPALISVTALWIPCRKTYDFGLKEQQNKYFW